MKMSNHQWHCLPIATNIFINDSSHTPNHPPINLGYHHAASVSMGLFWHLREKESNSAHLDLHH